MAILVFDTETTGLPSRELNHQLDHPDYPWPVSFAAVLYGKDRDEITAVNKIIRPDGWTVPEDASRIHGISHERAMDEGVPIREVLDEYAALRESCTVVAGHHVSFDRQIMRAALMRRPGEADVATGDAGKGRWTVHCTMRLSEPIVKMPPTQRMIDVGWGHKFKAPKLEECIKHFFGEDMEGAHDAMNDVRACARVLFHLADTGVIDLPATAAAA
ncbi:3'-5' exonuclease [Thalassobaculum sp.]|uniref:3'-5' exonuclease n=1 Tax=Thalassobaculum sp. TaxID=2022740 RepID=UPI0032EE1C75